jgi:methyl halide transferase
MERLLPNATTIIDWDAAYRQGTPPWDAGRPHAELVRVVEDGLIPRGSVLELGCGTGADAVYLARQGFDVTAVEISPIALERARVRAEREDALVHFVLDDVFPFAPGCGPFDLVYDAGFYHFVRRRQIDRFIDLLWRVTRPGSHYFCLAGAGGRTGEGGPPQVDEDDIHDELGRLFETVHLRRCRLEGASREAGYPAWSCLMRRPTAGRGPGR